MGTTKRPRGIVVAIAATIAVCLAATVGSYHYGYLQGTRETIENCSTQGIVPKQFTPMPDTDPTEVQWEFRRNDAGELKLIRIA